MAKGAEDSAFRLQGDHSDQDDETALDIGIMDDQLVTVKNMENRTNHYCGLSVKAWKNVIGVLLVTGIAFSWVGATQFASSTYSPTFNAPFFTTWFSTCWMLVVFPVYFLPSAMKGKSLKMFYRESETVFGPRGLRPLSMLTHAGFFSLLWMVTNYLYIRALGILHPADVTALFSSSNAFVYMLSWIWLNERISIIKVSAVLLSIGGIVLMAYAEGFVGPSATGVILSVASAVGAALYKVLFKRVIGNATGSQVSLFLSCLGVVDAVLLWPIIIIFHFTDYELIDWSSMPWIFLCGTGILALVFNFLINFGIALTYPLFISLGTVLGIPINALADFIFRGKDFGPFKIIAAVLIVLGFLFMLLPDDYEDVLKSKVCCCKKKSGDQDLELEYAHKK